MLRDKRQRDGSRKETGKHGKGGLKRKWYALAQPPYSPQRIWRQSPTVEPLNSGIDHPTRSRTQEAGIVKG